MRSLSPQGVRSQVDHLLDRRPVEAQQCVELSRTNDRRLPAWCGELYPFSMHCLLALCQTHLFAFVPSKIKSFGDWSDGGTPGYISNPVVKPVSADGTGSADSWESRSSPKDFFV